ncbi:phosphoribosylamine--glycine ligase [candidate division KSB1 bacterium]|nr:phosphoribosylamine--glycine ligase [candidate division KSB1 bacterium]
MKILVVGGGGREHALVWKLSQSPKVEKIFCASGNAGISQIAQCVDMGDSVFESLAHFAEENGIDLTVVGPEVPLVKGIVDYFQERELPIFGPTRQAAQIEGSKCFAKEFMARHDIPTAAFQNFDNPDDAIDYIKTLGAPVVIKADGLAAGKGSIVCPTVEEAFGAVKAAMIDERFGPAGREIVIEEFLEGEEASVFALTDGQDFINLAPAQDHKPIFDGDKGPNTGGMGAYAPAPLVHPLLMKQIEHEIIEATIQGMNQEGREYRGMLYCGLMITPEGLKVVEFNCRFGDPETQAVLPLMGEDLLDLLLASVDGNIKEWKAKSDPGMGEEKSAVCVVLASGGYPGGYQKGKEITGLEKVESGTLIFHAGTRWDGSRILTNGGRVLGVTVVGDDLESAIKRVYQEISKIQFENMYYRKDIGLKGLKR